jgi:DNA-directed RNA polymerase specialized sigma24 family protein
VYRFFHNKCSGGTEDLTGPQLAEVLGISEPGVRSRIARAKEALRKRVAELA